MRIQTKRLGALIFYAWLLGLTILLFYNFARENAQRIEGQNGVYAEEATRQIAAQIAQRFAGSQQLIDAYARFLEHSAKSPESIRSMLEDMERNSSFDAVRFMDADGQT